MPTRPAFVIHGQPPAIRLAHGDGHGETLDLRVLADELDDTAVFPAGEPWDARMDPARVRFGWTRVREEPAYFRATLDAYLRLGHPVLTHVPTDP